MDASLTQQRRVKEEGWGVVNFFLVQNSRRGYLTNKPRLNHRPAAAVIRRWQALTGRIGCKGRSRRDKSDEIRGLNPRTAFETVLSIGEVTGILCEVRKCVDIRKNTSGEGTRTTTDGESESVGSKQD